jgi:transposase
MRYVMQYKDLGADQYEKDYRNRVIKNLKGRAEEFGWELQPKAQCVS